MWWWKLSRKQKFRRAAFAFWSAPLVTLPPIWLGALYEPSMILEDPEAFIYFFGIPFGIAAGLYWAAAKVPSE